MARIIPSSIKRSLVLAGVLAVMYAALVMAAVMAVFRAEFTTALALAFVALGLGAASTAVSRASMSANPQ